MTEKKQHQQKSKWQEVVSNLQQQRTTRWALRLLVFMVVLAFIGPFIANDKPLWCSYKEETHFPLFKSWAVDLGIGEWQPGLVNKKWQDLKLDDAIWPLIPYAPNTTDLYNSSSMSPFADQGVESIQFRHWLGTDNIGRDVLAGLIWGTRTALLVGLISMFIAGLIGISLGAVAGYFGDHDLRLSQLGLLFGLLVTIASFFVIFMTPFLAFSDFGGLGNIAFTTIVLIGLPYVGYLLGGKIGSLTGYSKKVALPADTIIMRMIEVLNSIPNLLLLLVIVGLMRNPSIMMIMMVIGFLSWTTIARFVRGELLRIRELEYVDAAKTLGYKQWHILRRHALPNALEPVLITLAFGISAAILSEAGLSFLGIGVSSNTVTWGTLLNSARFSTSAWWLAVFPGLAIFVTVFVFNYLGEGFSRRRSR